jgi:hypothetical protein
MIEDYLLQYGILGLWTASLLIDRYRFQTSITKAINELTKAIKEKKW